MVPFLIIKKWWLFKTGDFFSLVSVSHPSTLRFVWFYQLVGEKMKGVVTKGKENQQGSSTYSFFQKYFSIFFISGCSEQVHNILKSRNASCTNVVWFSLLFWKCLCKKYIMKWVMASVYLLTYSLLFHETDFCTINFMSQMLWLFVRLFLNMPLSSSWN